MSGPTPAYAPSSPKYEPTPSPSSTYTATDAVCAWCAFLLGYLFCRTVPLAESPLGGLLFIWVLLGGVLTLLRLRRCRLNRLSVGVLISAVVVSLSLLLTADSSIRSFAYLYALTSALYVLYAANGNARTARLSDMLAVDYLRILIVFPFSSLGHIYAAAASARKKKAGGVMLKVLIGLCLTLIPTLIIASQLSYDADFSALLSRIFSFEPVEIFSHVGSILLGIPVGMYLYGAYHASVNRRQDALTATACRKAATKLRIAPAVTVVTAVLPILFLYVLFFISQWKYYLSGFTGVLPQDYTYAEYAREGFFQLCFVCFLNLVILALISLFLRRREQTPPRLLRILSLVLAVFTLILIATALSKMALYIRMYGLTPKRVYATWGMLVLTALFLLIIVKQFVRRLQIVACSLVTAVVMFSALSLSGIDSLIASYNVRQYQAGNLVTVDISSFDRLGEAAVPAVADLVAYLDEQNGTKLSEMTTDRLANTVGMYRQAAEFLLEPQDTGDSLFSLTLPRLRAKAAMERLGVRPMTESQWEEYQTGKWNFYD